MEAFRRNSVKEVNKERGIYQHKIGLTEGGGGGGGGRRYSHILLCTSNIRMCRCEGCGFQAVLFGIGHRNQPFARKGHNFRKLLIEHYEKLTLD